MPKIKKWNSIFRKTNLMVIILLSLTFLAVPVCEKNNFEKLVIKSKNRNSNTRVSAIDSLAESSDPRAVKIIVNALKDKSLKVRIKAIESLGKIADSTTIIYILPLLEDKNENIRNQAILTLAEFGVQAVGLLIKIIKNGNVLARESAIETLIRMGNVGATDSLVTILYEQDRGLKKVAADALAKLGWVPSNQQGMLDYIIAKQDFYKCLNFGQTGIDSLLALLNDKSTTIRIKSINALGKSKNVKVGKRLFDMLNDRNKTIKNAAFNAYINIHDKSLEALKAILDSESDYAREKVVEELQKIEDTNVIDLFYRALRDRNRDVRLKSLRALEQINDPNSIPQLVSALRDWYIGDEVLKVLTNMGWQVKSASDKVHVFVINRDGARMRKHWKIVTTILLEDIHSEDYLAIENALFAFVGVGRENILEDLIKAIKENGTKTMAEAYLNSNHKALFNAAKEWALKQGYRMEIHSRGQCPVSWNSF